MRKIIINRGIPGSGKSSLIDKVGLSIYSLSMDNVRNLYSSPELLSNGQFSISQSQNMRVHHIFSEILEERMSRGELIVIDNTSLLPSDIENFKSKAKFHRYEMLVLDYTKIPFEQLSEQNKQRPEHKVVNDAAMARMYNQSQLEIDYTGVDVIYINDINKDFTKVNDWLTVPVLDFSHYKEVVHIGDLQGCLTVLLEGPLQNGFRADTAYVFVGDLLDRGLENGILFKWFYENALPLDNVYLMWGNHEDHIHRYSRGIAPVSEEFEMRTLPQLKHSKITPQMADEVCAKALEVLPYEWNGTKVLVTHAGLSSMPALHQLAYISRHQYGKGTGEWTDPVDEQFMRNSNGEWYQVHGHRNHGMVGVQATPRSFNLEDQVEFGGNLRLVSLNSQGWIPQNYRNRIYKKRRINVNDVIPEGTPLYDVPPAWMRRENETVMQGEIFDSMVNHEGVRVGQMGKDSNIISLNFTKQVFNKKSWDDLLVKARGLFVNKRTMQIVARGYEKFFNVGERPETKMDFLMNHLHFPVTSYVKENGFLGNLGYDAEKDELFIASKASSTGEFAGYFKSIFNETVSVDVQDRIRRWLRDNEASMVFEVIDPKNDPHMIDYEQPKLVLLDVFHRSTEPEKLDYDHLKSLGERFGLEVKQRGPFLKNAQQLQGFYNKSTSDLSFRYQGKDIEGFVLEDARGQQTKIKLPHYAFWKKLRTQKDRLGKILEQKEGLDPNSPANLEINALQERFNQVKEDLMVVTEPENKAIFIREIQHLNNEISAKKNARNINREYLNVDMDKMIEKATNRDKHPLFREFMTWAATQTSADLFNKDILTLRKEFLAANPVPASLYKEPWIAFEEVLAEDFDKGHVEPSKPTFRSIEVKNKMTP